MAFHDVRLPESIARNYVGGRGFLTVIVPILSGFEARDIKWSIARGRWRLGFPLDEDQYETVTAFFYCRSGRGHSFRLKNWHDYKLGDDGTDTYQSIGTADGIEVDFQIYKRYSSGGINYDHTLTKMVAGTVRVWVDDVEQVSGWTVDLLTGIVTFSVAPADTLDVAVLCEFDTPVRFDVDDLEVNMLIEPLASIPSLPIIEVKGE